MDVPVGNILALPKDLMRLLIDIGVDLRNVIEGA